VAIVVVGAAVLLAVCWTAPRSNGAVAAWLRAGRVKTHTLGVADRLAVAAKATTGAARAASNRGPATVTCDAGHDFTMVGVMCDVPSGQGDVTVLLRTSLDGSRWSRWYDAALEIAGDGNGAPRAFTEAMWMGSGRYVQVKAKADGRRAPLSLGGVRLVAIDTNGGDSIADRATSLARHLVATIAGVGTVAPAVADSAHPAWVTRAGWGADESLRNGSPSYASVKMAFVHHTAGSNTYSAADAPALVRGIYAYHTQSLGWNDIGYNFLIDRFGTIYVGRYGGASRGVVGAQVYGFNTGSTGISVMGTYTSDAPPAAAMDALERLLAWKLGLSGLNPKGTATMTCGGTDKFKKGQTVKFSVISGHRDANYTECPGDALYAQLPTVRTAVANLMAQNQAASEPWKVTLKVPATSVDVGTVVRYSGTVHTAAGAAGSGTVTVQKRPAGGGSWTNWRKAALSGSGKYAVSVKMTSRYTWQFRARMPRKGSNLTAYSQVATLRVGPPLPWKVALAEPGPRVDVGTEVAYSGTITTATGGPASGTVTVQKRAASGGSWINWRTVTLDAAGAYSVSVTMVNALDWQFRARMPADDDNARAYSHVVGLCVGPPEPWKVGLALSAHRIRANHTITCKGVVTTAAGTPGSGEVMVQKRPASGGRWKNWRRATLSGSGKYSVRVKMTSRQRSRFRVRMLGNADCLTAYSPSLYLRVY
jgi:hypothetical protein